MTDIPGTLIIGAGALGSVLAARLHDASHPVTLLARGKRFAAIAEHGVLVHGANAVKRSYVPCAERLPNGASVDAIILATKSFDLLTALDQLHDAGIKPREILTVQNGVEAPDMVQAAFPEANVLASRVHGFFEMEGDIIRHAGVTPEIVSGPVCLVGVNQTSNICRHLSKGGLAVRQLEDIRPTLWEKFILASAIGGVGAALGRPAGQLCSDDHALSLLEAALHEIAALAQARGIPLPSDIAARTLDFVRTFPRDATSSLQRDLEAKRRSEYGQLTGAVLRFAYAANVDVPVHRQIDDLIRHRGLNPDLG